MNENWIRDPLLAQIPMEKLLMLQTMTTQAGQKSRQDLMVYLMAMARNPGQIPLNFTDSEKQVLLTVVQKYASPQEAALISQALMMASRYGNNNAGNNTGHNNSNK
ncbi:MAG TPA: hypothetical protein DF613_10850 [Lachnospiraceae bacterium]|nr:hypothetical protein [Lachnospiraceae bacterium]